MIAILRCACVIVLASGCIDEVAPRWTLDHDHVVAVRAEPPRIMPGERAAIDGLVAHAGGRTSVETPVLAAAPTAPSELQAMVSLDGGVWTVTAPPPELLASARPAMGIVEGAPVPLDVVMTFPGASADEPLYVKKTVWLGARAENPAPPEIVAGGVPVGAGELAIPRGVDVYVSVPEPAAGARVNWLTSCGTLYQDDVATAFLHVLPDEECTAGELAVVVRSVEGGVAWRTVALQLAD